MDIEKCFRELAGFFDADKQVKAMVGSCYIRDGDDLIELFGMGWKSDRNNRSYRSKLFINLRMAIECYLKGLVIVYSENGESPEDAYTAARRASHQLAALIKEVQSRSKWTKRYFKKASDDVIAQIDSMKVGLRYEIDMSNEFSNETFAQQILDSGHMSGTIGSDNWMKSLFEHATYFGRKASKAFAQKLGDHESHLGLDSNTRSQRINQFMSKVGIK